MTSAATTRPPDAAAFAAARWLAHHHDRPWTDAAVRARLPVGADPRDPMILARALAATGLRSRLVLRRLDRIDPAVLPVLLFPHNGPPIVLLGFSPDGVNARILDPETDADAHTAPETAPETPEREVPTAKLAATLRREVMLVAPEDGLAGRRLSADRPDRPRHWFWTPFLQNRAGWTQVAVAALCINLLGLALPIFVMNVYDRVIPNAAFVTLWTLAIGVGIAIGLDLILRAVRSQVLESIGRRLDTGIAATLFAHALALRPLSRKSGASVLASQIRDFETVREFFSSASFVSLIDTLFIGVFLWVLWLIVGELALVPTLAVPAVIVLALLAQVPMGRIAGEVQDLAGQRHSVLTEALMGHETVKTLGAEPVLQREWERSSAAAARVNGRSRFWSNLTMSGTQMIQQAVSVVVIVWGVFLVADGRISIGALIAANILAGRALAPLGAVSHTIFRAQYALKALRTLSAFMAIPPEAGLELASAARVRRGAVRLDGVTFRYPDADRAAVSDVSLSIAPGECVAILGRVGSGKSTMGKLIAGLLAADTGKVLIDDRSAGQYDPAELRAGIGYLPQETDLFTGTLRENLVIGRPDASEADIARALADSALAGFVEADPAGLSRFIGEKGGQLSGGQRQGVALARLLLRRPKFLFLDEPTNAMDRDMEAEVARRLQALTAAGTGLALCTHRPGLAQIAPRWIVMDQGRVVLDDRREVVMARLRGGQPSPGASPERSPALSPKAAE